MPSSHRSASKAELARLALEGGEEKEGFSFADKISALMHASHFPLGEVTIEYRDLRVVRCQRGGLGFGVTSTCWWLGSCCPQPSG